MSPEEAMVERALAILEGTIAGQHFLQAELDLAQTAADKAVAAFISSRRRFFRTPVGELASLPRCKALPANCARCLVEYQCEARMGLDALLNAYETARHKAYDPTGDRVPRAAEVYAAEYANICRHWLAHRTSACDDKLDTVISEAEELLR